MPVEEYASILFALNKKYRIPDEKLAKENSYVIEKRMEYLFSSLGFTKKDLIGIIIDAEGDIEWEVEELESNGIILDDLKEDYYFIRATRRYYDSSNRDGYYPGDDPLDDKFYPYFFQTRDTYIDSIDKRRTIIKDVLILIYAHLESG